MVSPNIGRTLAVTRQAALEVNQAVQWLRQQGYRRVGVVGTSIGSCIAYLAFVHYRDIDVGVFNHVSPYFADVVWTGLSTRYVRWGLEGQITLPDLRLCWLPISPAGYVQRLSRDARPHLMITARYDLTFRPRLSDQVFLEYDRLKIPYHRAELPCGHYTTAHFPFKYLDGWHIARFLHRHLRE
jgi:predicted acylesterase/phospholipase RssA